MPTPSKAALEAARKLVSVVEVQQVKEGFDEPFYEVFVAKLPNEGVGPKNGAEAAAGLIVQRIAEAMDAFAVNAIAHAMRDEEDFIVVTGDAARRVGAGLAIARASVDCVGDMDDCHFCGVATRDGVGIGHMYDCPVGKYIALGGNGNVK